MGQIDYPTEVKNAIRDQMDSTVCGGRFTVIHESGPFRGMPVTLYCAEPLCIDTHECTGCRLVPHPQQYTHVDSDHPTWGPRKMTPPEIIWAVQTGAELARKKGARRLDLSPTEIARFVGRIWQAISRATRGEGNWSS